MAGRRRNFTLEGFIGGHKRVLRTGPLGPGGIMELDLYQMDGTKEVLTFKVNCLVQADGSLLTEVLRADGGRLAKVTVPSG